LDGRIDFSLIRTLRARISFNSPRPHRTPGFQPDCFSRFSSLPHIFPAFPFSLSTHPRPYPSPCMGPAGGPPPRFKSCMLCAGNFPARAPPFVALGACRPSSRLFVCFYIFFSFPIAHRVLPWVFFPLFLRPPASPGPFPVWNLIPPEIVLFFFFFSGNICGRLALFFCLVLSFWTGVPGLFSFIS